MINLIYFFLIITRPDQYMEYIRCPLSSWALKVGEWKSIILRTSILKPKKQVENGGKLSVLGSPVAS